MARPEARGDESRDDWLPLLDDELSRLPEKYRLAIVLCELEGKTRQEAAKLLGWPEGTVASRLARGRAMLARRLARRGVELPAAALSVVSATGLTAHVPEMLIESTAKAANWLASGQAGAGAISAHVTALTERTVKTILLSKLKMATMAVALLGIGTMAFSYAVFASGKQSGATRESPPQPQALRQPMADGSAQDRKRVDQYGDALPDGAVARLGTVRFRQNQLAAFSADGKMIAVEGVHGISIMDASTGKILQQLKFEGGGLIRGGVALAFSPDGKQLARSTEGGLVIEVWDLATLKAVHRFQTRKDLSFCEPNTHSLVFSGDGKRLFTADDAAGHVWDLTTGRGLSSFSHMVERAEGRDSSINTTVFTQDGRLLATASTTDKTIRVWTVATGKLLHEFAGDNFGCVLGERRPPGDRWMQKKRLLERRADVR